MGETLRCPIDGSPTFVRSGHEYDTDALTPIRECNTCHRIWQVPVLEEARRTRAAALAEAVKGIDGILAEAEGIPFYAYGDCEAAVQMMDKIRDARSRCALLAPKPPCGTCGDSGIVYKGYERGIDGQNHPLPHHCPDCKEGT